MGSDAKNAHWAKDNSDTGLLKYINAAEPTPYARAPRNIWFKYSVIICFLEKVRSKRRASIASFILREMLRSDVKKKFFATCCVMVDAPEKFVLNPSIRAPLLTIARRIPWASIPG